MNKLTKVFALLLVVALASTTFYVGTQLNSTVSTLGDEQNVSPVDLESSLEFDPLHVSIEGESKLPVNVSSMYEAVVGGGSGNFGYVWSVDPLDGKTVFVSDGDTCSFMFVVATVDPYVLTVEVTDLVSGNKAFDSFTVYDPYTLPDLYLEASLANFDYRVKGDGVGWFFVSEGVSGKTLFSSTVLSDAVDYALASAVSGNILLDGVYFNYSLTVPVNVSVTESVDGLTRVFVNAANSQGSPYTVSVDTVNPTYYLAQDSAGRFVNSWSSTDVTDVIQDSLDTADGDKSCILKLNFIGSHWITRPIVMNKGSQYIEGVADGSTPKRGTWLMLANNVNNDVIYIDGTTEYDYYGVSRVWIYGNKAAQSAGNGIHIKNAGHVELHHIQISDVKNYGLHVEGGQIMEITSVAAMYCGSRGLNFQSLDYKTKVTSCWAFGNPANIYINNCADTQFSDLKSYNSTLYTGITLEHCHRLKIYGLNSENSYLEGIKFYGSTNNTVFGGVVENNGVVGPNAYAAVSFVRNPAGVNSTNNLLVGLHIYCTPNNHKYSVYEADANQDYNIIQSTVTSGASTAEIFLQGAHSKLIGYNGTVWVNPAT